MNKTVFRLALIFTLSILMFAGPRPVDAADQVVSDCGDSGGMNQLRAVLNAVQSSGGGMITFSCGPTIVLNAYSGTLPTITTNVTIEGGNTITLSGNNASRLFFVDPGATLTLNNLTITKGWADGDGGAVYVFANGTLNINGCKFLDNQTTMNGNGGAIISFGTLNISNSEFSFNKAASGGALYPTGMSAVAAITRSNFHDNEAIGITYGWGGAIYMSAGANVTITDSALSLNRARDGGAILIYYTSGSIELSIHNSTLNENWASDIAGGIFNVGGGVFLHNVTLSSNAAGQFGGGIYNSGEVGGATLFNVTLSNNWASVGGGIYNEVSPIILYNTGIAKGLLGQNCVTDASHPFNGVFNLSDDASCGFGAGRDSVNLLFGPLSNNGGPTLTHMPQPGSPAIDGGTGFNCPSTDQRGASRAGVGTACDVGSVEFGGLLPWLYLPFLMR